MGWYEVFWGQSALSVGEKVPNAYSSTSASCCRAFLAMVWKACSTFTASLAEVSKYGILPFDWHQVMARF